ncbi:hypothetical protein DXG01_012044, partial [Tephrocybe rancida]
MQPMCTPDPPNPQKDNSTIPPPRRAPQTAPSLTRQRHARPPPAHHLPAAMQQAAG